MAGPIAEIVYRPSEPNPRILHYRHHEALGSVSVTTSQGGPVTRRYYEPFGGRVKFNGSPAAATAHDIRHGFTGHQHECAMQSLGEEETICEMRNGGNVA